MSNHTLQKQMFQSGALLAAIAVALGAFAAHQFKDMIDAPSMVVFEKAVRYQFIHALAIIMLSAMLRKLNEKIAINAWKLFLYGTAVFCGALYLYSTRTLTFGQNIRWVGGFAPVGGMCYIVGWGLLAYKGFKSNDQSESSRSKKFYAKQTIQPSAHREGEH